jgi:hypothetical protein
MYAMLRMHGRLGYATLRSFTGWTSQSSLAFLLHYSLPNMAWPSLAYCTIVQAGHSVLDRLGSVDIPGKATQVRQFRHSGKVMQDRRS